MTQEVSKANKPTNDHYVPQRLLRNFADKDSGQIFVSDKQNERRFRTSTRNIASQVGFHSFFDPKLECDDTFEPAVTWIEDKGLSAIESILSEGRLGHLSVEQQSDLTLFSAAQLVRTVGFRKRYFNMCQAGREEAIRKQLNPDDEWPLLDKNQIQILFLDQIGRSRDYAEFFNRKAWLLFEATEKSTFLISDNPVVLDHRSKDVEIDGLGLGSEGIEIYFPISPKYCLCFVCPTYYRRARLELTVNQAWNWCGISAPRLEREVAMLVTAIETGVPLTIQNVAHYNRLQVRSATRFVFSNRENWDEEGAS